MGNQFPMYGTGTSPYQMAIPNPSQVVIPQITVQPTMNPYQPMMQVPQPEVMGPQLAKVKGMDGAKQFQTVPNAVYALFDETENVLFFKATDKNNYPILLKRFRYVEEEEPVPQQPEYVTKQEYDSLLEDFRKLKEEVSNGKQYIQPTAESAADQSSASKRTSKPST